MSYRITTEGFRVRRTDDGGMLVFDERTDVGHVLNPSVAVVYDLCDGTRSVADMARYVAAETGLPADEEIVILALAQLREAGLLDESEETTASLASVNTGLTRRSLIKRLAVGAGALTLLPAIDSIANVSKLAAVPATFTAVSISVTTTGGQPVSVTLSATGQPSPGTLTFTIVTPPQHGTAVINGNILTYTPGPGFEGSDVMTYQATVITSGTTTAGTTGGTTTPATTAGPVSLRVGSFGRGRSAGVHAQTTGATSDPGTITISVGPAALSASPSFTG